MQMASSLNILKQKLIDCEAVKFGNFTLTSGKKSKFYVDMKLASTDPEILSLIAKEFAKNMPDGIDFIAGMELGAVPLAVALSLETGIPSFLIQAGRLHLCHSMLLLNPALLNSGKHSMPSNQCAVIRVS